MIVVDDTSPLTNLAAIRQVGLLHRLYGQIVIAEGVWSDAVYNHALSLANEGNA